MQTFSLNKQRQTRSEMLLCDFQNILTKKKEKKKSLFTGSFNILWSASLEAMLLSSFFLQRILLWRTGLTAEQLLSTVAVQSASLEEKQTILEFTCNDILSQQLTCLTDCQPIFSSTSCLGYLPSLWPAELTGPVVEAFAAPHRWHFSNWSCQRMPAGRWLALRIAIATGRPAPPVAAPPGAGHKRSSEPRVQGSNITGQCRRSLVTVEFSDPISSTLNPALFMSI